MNQLIKGAPRPNQLILMPELPRIYVSQLLALRLDHLLSGLDDECPAHVTVSCGHNTMISGYTEWLAKRQLAISIGWDWRISQSRASDTYLRYGPLRTNIILINENDKELSDQSTQDFVGQFIDSFDWQARVAQFIQNRYA